MELTPAENLLAGPALEQDYHEFAPDINKKKLYWG